MELTHGSLFSGIGGFDLGFERAGFTTVWQVENGLYCQAILAQHFPDAQRFGDIRTICWDKIKQPTVLSGGSPCQDISVAGKAAGLQGARSGLWSYFYRAISILRPSYVVVENVSALLFRGLGRVLGDLSEIGYDAEWEVISAHTVGAPHLRERVFLIAYPNRLNGQTRLGIITDGAIARLKACMAERHELWLQTRPDPNRMGDGLPARLYRPRVQALGNAVVPQIAEEIAWMIRRVIEGGAVHE